MVSGSLRVFVAIDIGDAEILSRLENARDLILSTKADVKPVSRENMHITLRFIGEVPLELANEICKALETVTKLKKVTSIE
jgi:2'-5' RNA ligase